MYVCMGEMVILAHKSSTAHRGFVRWTQQELAIIPRPLAAQERSKKSDQSTYSTFLPWTPTIVDAIIPVY